MALEKHLGNELLLDNNHLTTPEKLAFFARIYMNSVKEYLLTILVCFDGRFYSKTMKKVARFTDKEI